MYCLDLTEKELIYNFTKDSNNNNNNNNKRSNQDFKQIQDMDDVIFI